MDDGQVQDQSALAEEVWNITFILIKLSVFRYTGEGTIWCLSNGQWTEKPTCSITGITVDILIL